MTAFWIVVAVVLVVGLGAARAHDRRARARGARLNPDAGAQSGRRGTGDPEAYRVWPELDRGGW